MQVKLKLTKNDITSSINKIQRGLSTVPNEVYGAWVKVTPKDTGNARNKTKLVTNTIEANYPYAKRLDRGWSRQSPQGMYVPTLQFFKRLMRSIIRK